MNPEATGTKVAAHYRLTVAAGESEVVLLHVEDSPPAEEPEAAASGWLPFRRRAA